MRDLWRRLRRGRPVLLTCLAITVGATATGGTPVVLTSPRSSVGTSTGEGVSAAGPPTAYPVPPIVAAMSVVPLDRIVLPDALVVAERSIDPATRRKLSGIAGVRDVVSFDAGSVRLRGRLIDVVGVRPSAFRAWTPPPAARAERLWTALVRDEFVTSFDARQEWDLELGANYLFEGRRSPWVRFGAAASLGLPGVDALVSERTSERLGLVRDIGVMVNAPGTTTPELATALHALLGKKAQVVTLRKHESSGRLPTGGAPHGKALSYLDLYKQAAEKCPGLSWTVLAAIGQIESGHGRNNGPSSAGALGPMQFIPATWAVYGTDGDGDGRADIMNPYDAVPSAAGYLCAAGAGRGRGSMWEAIWRYNHADWYVREVLSLARAYAHTYG